MYSLAGLVQGEQLESDTFTTNVSRMSQIEDADFSHLPREIIVKILGELSNKDLFVLVRVSKRWWELGGDPFLWKNFKLQVTGSNLVFLESILGMPIFPTSPACMESWSAGSWT